MDTTIGNVTFVCDIGIDALFRTWGQFILSIVEMMVVRSDSINVSATSSLRECN